MPPPQSLIEWMKTFRDLHEQARAKKLSPEELVDYRAARDELARALLSAQRLTVKPGETPRSSLRVARALQVDLDMLTSTARAITVDLCTGGFACLLAKAPSSMGDEVGFSLRLPGAETMTGKVRVADVKSQQGNVRVSFQFSGMSAEERERIEMFVFDTVLAQIQG
jgi:hypothetical protein